MSSFKQKRNRGIMLTAKGLEKIQAARSNWECQENFGERSTYENISELTNLDINTIKKILSGRERVDKRSLEKFYLAFKLKLDEEYYTKFNLKLRENWGESVSIEHFFGRATELETLTSWLVSDRCRLVAIQGMGGIGKTTLSIKFAQQIKGQFDCIIWKSLRDAIPATEILAELIEFLSEGKETEINLPKRVNERITRLISYLRSQRCLILLDNAESLLDNHAKAGKYRQECEKYGELLTRVGATSHDSCLILTTREKLQEIAALEGEKLAVRSLRLTGLKTEGHEIFKLKGLNASESELNVLSDRLGGNPLALKVVSTTIQDLFGGDVSEFLRQEKGVFGDIHDILAQQFNRLSNLEPEIMYWLASDREPISLQELQADLLLCLPTIKILETLESLSRRSLIEKNAVGFTQQPVVMEYVTSRLIEASCAEIISQNPQLLQNHALIKATTKDYIKENQNRLILQPLIEQLLTVFNHKQDLEIHLKQILANLQQKSCLQKGYTAGNIINLLSQMETDLTGYDFSNLCVWQADLRQTQLHQVNFQNADLSKSVFAENFGGIWSVAFSPDGKYLAAGDTKGDIILRRVADGQPILRFTGHKGWVVSLAFSPDGNTLASGSCDCTAKLWNVNSGQCLHSLEAHQHEVWSVAFHPDGKILASGCDDHLARLWNVNTGQCLQIFQGHTNAVLSVVFSLDGKELITASHDRTIKLWNLNTNKCQRVLQGHEDGVRAVSLSPCGQMLASSSNDCTIRLWDLKSGKCLQVLQGHVNVVLCVTFSPKNGHLLASSSIGHKVRLWDLKTGECLKVFHGHSNMINSVAFNPQSNILASGSYDQSVKLWDMDTYQCVKTWQGYSNQALSIAFSPNGLFSNGAQTLASGGHDRKIRLWDLKTGEVVKTLKGHTNWVFSVAFSPKHNILASGSGDKTVKVWDLHSGKVVKTLLGHQAAVRSIAFSPNGQTLASSGDDRTIQLWDLQTNQTVQTLQEHQAEIWSIAFSADGQTLASGSFDSTVKLWDIQTGKCLKTLDEHQGWVWSVGFSPNRKTLASTSVDQTIRFWDLETGECQTIMQEDLGHSQLICFSRDGQILASCNAKHNIKLWNANNGKYLKSLEGHQALVNSIAFNPDSSTLISSSEDETIKIWDLESGECIQTLKAKNPYEKMDINGITGLTKPTIETLKILGATGNVAIN
jgi:WD40 repeat protein